MCRACTAADTENKKPPAGFPRFGDNSYHIIDCIAIEAGVTGFWRKYVGLDGKVVGIDRFGLSAPAPQVFKELGITTEALIAAARSC